MVQKTGSTPNPRRWNLAVCASKESLLRASTSRLVFYRPSPGWIWVTAAALTVTLFVSDLLTPLGVNLGVLYVLVILLTLWLPSARASWGWAAVCTVFLTVGYFLSPPGGIQEDGVSYRALAVVLIWAAAVLANAKKRTAKAFRLAVQQGTVRRADLRPEGTHRFCQRAG